MKNLKLFLCLLPALFSSCCETEKDFFPENQVMICADGVSRDHRLTETEKEALNGFICRHATFWNSSIVSYAESGKSLQSAQTHLKFLDEKLIVIVINEPGGWTQYAVEPSEEEAAAWKAFFP